jgi:hypothetical protein
LRLLESIHASAVFQHSLFPAVTANEYFYDDGATAPSGQSDQPLARDDSQQGINL